MKCKTMMKKVCCGMLLLCLVLQVPDAEARKIRKSKSSIHTSSRAKARAKSKRPAKRTRVSKSTSQRRAARAALASLRKLESATRGDLCCDQYRTLVAETQAAVEKHLRAVPAGALKSELQEAMELYTIALEQWQGAVENSPRSQWHGCGGCRECSEPDTFDFSVGEWWRLAKQSIQKAEKLLR